MEARSNMLSSVDFRTQERKLNAGAIRGKLNASDDTLLVDQTGRSISENNDRCVAHRSRRPEYGLLRHRTSESCENVLRSDLPCTPDAVADTGFLPGVGAQ